MDDKKDFSSMSTTEYISHQMNLRGNVMYDRLTNPSKFADYEEWQSKVAGKFVAYKNAYEMLSSSNEYAKRAGKLAVQTRQYRAGKSAEGILQRAGLDGREQLNDHLRRLRNDIEYHQRAFDAVNEIEARGLSLEEVKLISEGLERKYWDVVERMEGGESNNPSIGSFDDILKNL